MMQPHSRDMAAIILAAGKSTRMKSAVSKVLHEVGGRSLLHHVLATCEAAKLSPQVVVTSPDASDVRAGADQFGAMTAVQDPPLGTGHAVQSAQEALQDFSGNVVVLFGDTPLIEADTIAQMVKARDKGADVVVLGFEPTDPTPYGRLIMNSKGGLDSIVEAKDASTEELTIGFVNSGVLMADADRLFELLSKVTNDNAKGEYYLTDVIGLANGAGLSCTAIKCDEAEVLGINSRADLAAAEAAFQNKMRETALAAGVTLVAPESVFFSHDTDLAADCWVGPNVVFGPGVIVGPGTRIKPFSHLEGASIAANADIGPYARLRPGADIKDGAKVGNFVEIKKATLEEGAKVNHLSYIGDARVGAKANIGAGVITCNYDGFNKFQTDIGAGAFIGSNTSLVAPVKVADGAYVGSGSVITKTVEADALALTRADFRQIKGWAAKHRARGKKKSGD